MKIEQSMEVLKTRILDASEEKGMNLAQVGRKAGLSASTMSRITSYSHYGNVRLSTLFCISQVLDKSVSWLIGEE